MAHRRLRASFAVALAVVTVLTGCRESEQSREEHELATEMSKLEDRGDALTNSADGAERRVAGLEERTARALSDFGDAAAAYETARNGMVSAAAEYAAAGDGFQGATETFGQAEQRYRIAAYSIIVLATTAAAAQAVCATRMTTSEFRASNGMTDPDVHVDHIWPHARGGLDHPLNYQPLDAHTNMSCGQGCLGMKLANAPLQFAIGVAVSVLGRLGCP